MLQVKSELCIGCGLCERSCPTGAITISFNKAHIDPQKCIGCENCISVCPKGAIEMIEVNEIVELKGRIQNLRQKVNWISQRLDKVATSTYYHRGSALGGKEFHKKQ